jgi:hypothetical protein
VAFVALSVRCETILRRQPASSVVTRLSRGRVVLEGKPARMAASSKRSERPSWPTALKISIRSGVTLAWGRVEFEGWKSHKCEMFFVALSSAPRARARISS